MTDIAEKMKETLGISHSEKIPLGLSLVVSIRLSSDLVDALKRRARLKAVKRDEDYSYTDLIRDVLYEESQKTGRENAK